MLYERYKQQQVVCNTSNIPLDRWLRGGAAPPAGMAGLQQALERFSGELRGFTSRLADSIGSLKRGADARPHAGGVRRRAAQHALCCQGALDAAVASPPPHGPSCAPQARARARARRAPPPAVDAFRENLEELERQAADIAADAAQLERVTTEAVSLEVRTAPFFAGMCSVCGSPCAVVVAGPGRANIAVLHKTPLQQPAFAGS